MDWILLICQVLGGLAGIATIVIAVVVVLTYIDSRRSRLQAIQVREPGRLGTFLNRTKVSIIKICTYVIVITVLVGSGTLLADSHLSDYNDLRNGVIKLNSKVEMNGLSFLKKIQSNAGKIQDNVREIIEVKKQLDNCCDSEENPDENKPNPEDQKALQDIMEIARISGYLFLLIPDNNAIINYHLVSEWVKEGNQFEKCKPLLLTDSEIEIIKASVKYEFKQDLTTLTFNNLKEIISQNGRLEYNFTVQSKIIKLEHYEKIAIIAAYINMLKIEK